MRSVFSSYISNIGKRYAKHTLIAETEITFAYNNIQKVYSVTEFEIQGKRIRFFESGLSGFLAKPATEIISHILPLHRKFVQEIGIVSDLYGFTNTYLQNLAELFSCDKASQDVENLMEDFQTKYTESEAERAPLGKSPLEGLITFAYETNGNRFMYNTQGEVFLYGMDHAYADIKQVSGYPKYTLYQVPQFHTFNDFVFFFMNNNH